MSKLSMEERRSLIVDVLSVVRSSSFPAMNVTKRALANKDPDQIISLDSDAVSAVFSRCCDHIIEEIAKSEKKH